MKLLQLLLLGLSACIVAAEDYEWYSPPGCGDMIPCIYTFKMTVYKDDIKCDVFAKQPNGTYIGIGFAKEKEIKDVEFIWGTVISGDYGTVVDAWILDEYTKPITDTEQHLINPIVTRNGEYLHLTFSHSRISDRPHEYNFVDTCLYPAFAVEGGLVLDNQGTTVDKPYKALKFSETKFCFNETQVSTTSEDLSTITETHNPLDLVDVSKGKFVYPLSCESTSSCVYTAKWELDPEKCLIHYEIEAKQPANTWTAIGYTDTSPMNNADVVYGYVTGNGEGRVEDGSIPDPQSGPVKDLEQNIQDSSIKYEDGLLKMKFTRPCILTDPKDLSFTDSICHYMVYPVEGGKVTDDGTLLVHSVTPIVSERKICIKRNQVTGSPMTSEPVTLSYEDDANEIERKKTWTYPMGCGTTTYPCLYSVSWKIDRTLGCITFKIKARQSDRTWTAIAFTKDPKGAYGSDVYYGFLDKSYVPHVYNGWWADLSTKPEKDEVQNLLNPTISCSGGYLFMEFTRKLKAENNRDFDFTVDADLYFIFVVGGGPVRDDDSDIEKPYRRPIITTEKIGFREDISTESTVSHSTTVSPDDLSDKEKKRVCYYSNKAQYRPGNGACLPEDLDSKLCTHWIYTYASIDDNNAVIPTDPKDDNGGYERFNNLMKISNAKTIVGIGGPELPITKMTTMLMTVESRLKFIQSLIAFVKKHNFNGVCLDFQYPSSGGSPPEDKTRFTLLCKETREAFEKEAKETGNETLVLAATVAGEKEKIDNGYEANIIHQYLHFINVMTMDLHKSTELATAHHCPLYPSQGSNPTDAQRTVQWSATYWNTLGVPKEKLVIGMATYGRGFTLADSNNHGIGATTVGPSPAGECTQIPGLLGYFEICTKLSDSSTTKVWMIDERVPYYYKGTEWMGYNDEKSLTEKANFVKTEGFGGYWVMESDYDDCKGLYCSKGPFPLMNTLHKTIMGSVTGSLPPLTKILESSTKSLTEITETGTTGYEMRTLSGLSCVGSPDGLYPYPGNCTMYIQCSNEIAHDMPCPQGTYWDTIKLKCNWPSDLSDARRKECYLN